MMFRQERISIILTSHVDVTATAAHEPPNATYRPQMHAVNTNGCNYDIMASIIHIEAA